MDKTRGTTQKFKETFQSLQSTAYYSGMKSTRTLFILVFSLLFSGIGVAIADEASDARATKIAFIQTKYNPGFDAQYVRLIAVQKKAVNDAGTSKVIKNLLTEFLGMRKTIDADLANPNSDLDTVLGFAEEELGEYDYWIYQIEQQIIKSKTITCVKGKTIKKVMALKPTCPKGFVKK